MIEKKQRAAMWAMGLGAMALAACSSEPAGSPTEKADGGAPPSMQEGALEAPPAEQGLQLRLESTLQPGEEIFYCQYYVLPAGKSLDISKFEHRYAGGSHHLLLFATD